MIELVRVAKMFPTKGEYCVTDKSIFIRCPGCGQMATLDNHTVKDDGTVTPSVVCPYPKEGCKFHDHLKLLQWTKM